MKLCYVDESGYANNDQPVLVLVGIIVDQRRANRTRQDFGAVFQKIKAAIPAADELKSTRVFYGTGLWSTIDQQAVRWPLFTELCGWIKERKHKVVLAAIDKAKFAETVGQAPEPLHNEFLACAMHVALQVQKEHKGMGGNKGHTFLIFDDNKHQVDDLPRLLDDPPMWTDSFYGREKKADALDQVIDTAFFAKSHIVGLVQVADFFAFVFRRYAELEQWGMNEKKYGEREFIAARAKQLRPQVLRIGWRKQKNSECATWYRNVAPEVLVDLLK
jgi:hypothetical protein